jgi:hypothetical protein
MADALQGIKKRPKHREPVQSSTNVLRSGGHTTEPSWPSGESYWRSAFVILSNKEPYKDPKVNYEELLVMCNAPRWIAIPVAFVEDPLRDDAFHFQREIYLGSSVSFWNPNKIFKG